MTDQHYDLRLAMALYLVNDKVLIPPFYHDHIVNAYKRSTIAWDTDRAAALTLFSAFYDGILQLADLSYPGRLALHWAEHHIDDLNIQPTVKR